MFFSGMVTIFCIFPRRHIMVPNFRQVHIMITKIKEDQTACAKNYIVPPKAEKKMNERECFMSHTWILIN